MRAVMVLLGIIAYQRYGKLTEQNMTMGTIVLIIVILALIGVFPTWPHSRSWGYAPSSALGAILLIVLILFLTGRI